MARLQATTLNYQLAGQRSIEAARAKLIETAKAKHAEVLQTDPKPSTFIRFVDGVRNAPEEAAKFDSVIVYDYPRVDLAAMFALETLRALSPVKSGHYQDSHHLYLNGIQVGDLKGWQRGDEVTLSNSVPYARKIEIGAMKMRVPGTDHVYAQAERIVRRKYGDLVKVKFTWRGLDTADGAVVHGKAGNASALRYPALIISEHA